MQTTIYVLQHKMLTLLSSTQPASYYRPEKCMIFYRGFFLFIKNQPKVGGKAGKKGHKEERALKNPIVCIPWKQGYSKDRFCRKMTRQPSLLTS